MNVFQPPVNLMAQSIQNALNIPVTAAASNGLVYNDQALYYTDAVSSQQQQQHQQLERVEFYQPNDVNDTIDDSASVTVAYFISLPRQEQLVASQCLVCSFPFRISRTIYILILVVFSLNLSWSFRYNM
ncbi:hypothetical protein QAD02_014011 [Eretmocerus hayati]|uniref:Uncharacterized protein n=1 Tax=Eretmocerus hayati TaxID=131215 RepID=A0ACC2P4H6_9HYME|nr:hypothetical protein QAD02_014011 [Eretmocerus hayati]